MKIEREPNTQYILSLSYGKDSLACLEVCKQLGYPIGGVMVKPINGYDGLYLITSSGLVYSVMINKLLKPEINRGYLQVTLYKDKHGKRFKVHRLVADAFITNPDNYPTVNHRDENKQNNDVSNLEWCNTSYNNRYGTKNIRSSLTQMNNAPLIGKTKPVLCTDTNTIYQSTKEAERQTGIYHSHISRCCNKTQLKAGGMLWRYAMEN